MPESADDVDKKNAVIDLILKVHENSVELLFDADERLSGPHFYHAMYYAIRNPDYFSRYGWLDDVNSFYQEAISLGEISDPVQKRKLYNATLVKAFINKARTGALLRERMRTDGHIRYYSDDGSHQIDRNDGDNWNVDYLRDNYEIYERVEILFYDVLQ